MIKFGGSLTVSSWTKTLDKCFNVSGDPIIDQHFRIGFIAAGGTTFGQLPGIR